MEKQVENKFVWVIKNLSSLQSENLYSDPFVIGGCKWRLLAIAQGNNLEYLCLYLGVAYSQSMPRGCGWRRYVKYRLSIANQLSEELSVQKEVDRWFGEKSPNWGSPLMFPIARLHAKDGGFLVNGELMVVAEVDVLQVIGKLDVSEETPAGKEGVNVNGFQVLPSQVESVRCIFERHPDIAVEFHAKNQHLRTTFMNFLLSLIETLYQPLQELSNEDLVEADMALTYLKDAGFKVDWLERKLDQVKEKKEKEVSCEARVQEMEAQLHDLKCKFEVEKAELSATRASISFDDIV